MGTYLSRQIAFNGQNHIPRLLPISTGEYALGPYSIGSVDVKNTLTNHLIGFERCLSGRSWLFGCMWPGPIFGGAPSFVGRLFTVKGQCSLRILFERLFAAIRIQEPQQQENSFRSNADLGHVLQSRLSRCGSKPRMASICLPCCHLGQTLRMIPRVSWVP